MPITPNETTAERAAVEQDAMEELHRKRASLRRAMEEAQQKAWEEEEVTAREWEEALAKAEAIRWAQEGQGLQGMLDVGLFL